MMQQRIAKGELNPIVVYNARLKIWEVTRQKRSEEYRKRAGGNLVMSNEGNI
jgi:hypothetical protein